MKSAASIRSAVLGTVLIVLCGVCPQLFAQDVQHVGATTKSVPIVRGNAPVLDGRLDEPVWQAATLIDDFHQIEPTEYAEPAQRTLVRFYYDDNALYVGARMFDTQPDAINATVLRQGAQFWRDDFFAVIISPFNDQRNGYRFQLNPNGVRMEMLLFETNRNDQNWNGIWYGAASRDDEGWIAEIAIPFQTLSFNPENDTWGINFSRDISRVQEKSGWVSRNLSQNPSISGEAVGFEGLQLGRGLDVVPSLTLRNNKNYEIGVSESQQEPSLDVYYKFTPSLNGSLTVNTDFSATEVDDRQVELTRFSLFFPEKRMFFLRDTDIFRFGRIGGRGGFGINGTTLSRPDQESGRPFFSRRIGLGAAGQPVDLEAGAKLSGRIGRWNLGALAIRQGQFEDIDATDVLVGRIAANVLAESSLGLIVTDGDPRSNLDNSLVGVDFVYNNTRLAGGRQLQAEAWYQQSDTEGIDDDQAAYGLQLRAPNRLGWRGGIGLKEIEDNFSPALGFVNRAGIRDHTAELGYARRATGDLFRTFFSGVDMQRIDLTDGDLQTQVVTWRAFEFETVASDQGRLRIHSTKETLTEPFVIWRKGVDQVVVPTGTYSFDEAELYFSTASQRTFWGEFSYRAGDYFDGERARTGFGVGWRPSNHFQLTANYDFNDVELPTGSFNTRLATLRADVIFSATMSWSTLLQYDNVSESMGINMRLHWIPEAGREFFIVLNHNLQDFDLDNRFKSAAADLAIKVNYTFRY